MKAKLARGLAVAGLLFAAISWYVLEEPLGRFKALVGTRPRPRPAPGVTGVEQPTG